MLSPILMEIVVLDRYSGIVLLPDKSGSNNYSQLECKVLDRDISDEHIEELVKMHNEAWSPIEITPETLKERVKNGILIGGFLKEQPKSLLEILALKVDEVSSDIHYKERVLEVCRALHREYGDYYGLTNGGNFFPAQAGANVGMMLDLTTHLGIRGKGIGDGTTEFFKALVLQRYGFERPPSMKDVEYVLTFSPKPNDYDGDQESNKGAIGLHLKHGAFNTGYVWKNGRPGSNQPDSIITCYLAPKYVPRFGDTNNS